MKNTFGVKLIYQFYHSSVKAELKRRGFSKDVAKILRECPEDCNGPKIVTNANMKMTGLLTFCREMMNTILATIITNVASVSYVRMRVVRSWRLICAGWTMCLPISCTWN